MLVRKPLETVPVSHSPSLWFLLPHPSSTRPAPSHSQCPEQPQSQNLGTSHFQGKLRTERGREKERERERRTCKAQADFGISLESKMVLYSGTTPGPYNPPSGDRATYFHTTVYVYIYMCVCVYLLESQLLDWRLYVLYRSLVDMVLLLIATRVSCFESCWPPTLQQGPPLPDTCPGSLGFSLGPACGNRNRISTHVNKCVTCVFVCD